MILYWISPLAYPVQERFRKVKYITLVNLLAAGELFPADTTPYDPDGPDADEALFPEYLTCEDKSPQIARHAIEWLTDRAAPGAAGRAPRAAEGRGGARRRFGPAAEYILAELGRRPSLRPARIMCPTSTRRSAQHGGRRGLSLAAISQRRRALAGAAW